MTTAAKRKASLTSRKLAKSIAGFASDKKALDIVILDMRKQVNFTDYFVICSGNTDRQVRAIADHMDEQLRELGIKTNFRKNSGKEWVVLDVSDVVIHVFQKQARTFYQLEYLWREAKQIAWED